MTLVAQPLIQHILPGLLIPSTFLSCVCVCVCVCVLQRVESLVFTCGILCVFTVSKDLSFACVLFSYLLGPVYVLDFVCISPVHTGLTMMVTGIPTKKRQVSFISVSYYYDSLRFFCRSCNFFGFVPSSASLAAALLWYECLLPIKWNGSHILPFRFVVSHTRVPCLAFFLSCFSSFLLRVCDARSLAVLLLGPVGRMSCPLFSLWDAGVGKS